MDRGNRSFIRCLAAGAAICVAFGTAGLVAGVGAASAAGADVGPTGDPDIFIASGYAAPIAIVSTDCTSLQQAVTSAEASANGGTILMMPGDYCPIVIPYGYHDVTFAGVGPAGFDTSGGPVTYDGPEAELSQFTWSKSACGTPLSYEVDMSAGWYPYGRVTFDNVGVDIPAGGPTYGFYVYGTPLYMRDVAVEGASEAGLFYESLAGTTSTDASVVSSAFVSDGVGVSAEGYAEIEQSTMADDSTGVEFTNSDSQLYGDTVADNSTGVWISGDENDVYAYNSIVGGNTTDCYGTVGAGGDWEYDGSGGGNGYNLLGESCEVGNSTDIALTDPIGSPAENGGPTPSIEPPDQAVGAADETHCSGADQREYLMAAEQ